mmetsp:Transcript_36812/g.63907  ORF Transcript_36812/g.63907 Transcript_36812/m.63907 type:complete len:365 (+) Transcript_36812:102-1196(+)
MLQCGQPACQSACSNKRVFKFNFFFYDSSNKANSTFLSDEKSEDEGVSTKTINTFPSSEESDGLNPSSSESLYHAAIELLAQGDQEQAVANLQHCVAIQGWNTDAWYRLGRIYEDNGYVNMAAKYFTKVISINPEHQGALDSFYRLGSTCHKNLDFDNAEYFLLMSTKLVRESADPWILLGLVYTAKDQHEKAIRAYLNAVTIEHNNPTPLFNLGNLYQRAGLHEKAIFSYRKAIERDPNHIDSMYNLAIVYDMEYNDSERAMRWYRKAYAADPNKAVSTRAKAAASSIAAAYFEEKNKNLKGNKQRVGSQVKGWKSKLFAHRRAKSSHTVVGRAKGNTIVDAIKRLSVVDESPTSTAFSSKSS